MRLACVLLVLLLAMPAHAVTTHGAYTSGGKRINYDWYHAAGTKKLAPTIVVLHGSGGFWGNVQWVDHYANMLAGRGYNVFILHYMDRTGHTFVSGLQAVVENFKPWMQAVRDGISLAVTKPGVDPERLGVVGLSLGSYLGLSIAAIDARVKAVAEFFGGYPDQLLNNMHRMPPVLILHGGADQIVPVSEAFKLMGLLNSVRGKFESKIYPEQGHGFDEHAAADAEKRVVDFLHRYLPPR